MIVSAEVLHLDGVGSYVELPDHLAANQTNLTVEVRAKWDHFAYFESPLHFGDQFNGVGFNHNVAEYATPKVFLQPSNRTAAQINGGAILKVGEWFHLAATFSASGFQFYVNGVCLGTNSTPYSTNFLSHPARWLGRSPWPDNGYFRGSLDDMAVWSRVLSEEEIRRRVHQPLTGTEPGLLAAWDFNSVALGGSNRMTSSLGFPSLPARLQRNAQIIPGSALEAPYHPPARIRGTVLGSDGRPAAARIYLWRRGRVTTAVGANDVGQFELNHIPDGEEYGLEVTQTEEGAWVDLKLEAGQVHDLKLRLRPRVSIQGRVSTMMDRPQAGVEVQAWRVAGTPEPDPTNTLVDLTLTDREGRYRFVNLRPGYYRVRVVNPTLNGISTSTGDSTQECWVTDSTNRIVANFRRPRLASPHSWRRYDRREGLPDSEVNAILPVDDGQVWVGTGGGLARLDSNGVTIWTQRDGLPTDTVTALFRDREGTLWIGTSQGLCVWKAGRLELDPDPSSPRTWIRSIAQTRDGTLWIGSDLGLAGRLEGAWRWFGPEQGLTDRLVRTLQAQPDGSLLIRTSIEFLRLHAGRISLWPNGRPIPGFPEVKQHWGRPEPIHPSSIRPYLWAAAGPDSAWCALGSEVFHYRDRWFRIPWDETAPQEILSLAVDARGSLWLGTQSRGIWRYQADLPETLNDADGLPGMTVLCSERTPDDTLWIGCEGGLASWRNGHIKVWGEQEGLGGRRVLSLLADRRGQLWVATEAGIFYLEGNRFRYVLHTSNSRVNHLNEGNGQIWIATSGNGLLRGSEQGLARFGLDVGLSHDFNQSVLVAHDNSVWLTDDRAVVRVIDGESQVYCLTSSRSDGQLISTNWAGLPTDRSLFLEGSQIREAPDGSIWVGTFRHGVWRYRQGVWTRYGPREGLPSSRIQALGIGGNGRIWCGTPQGASVFDGEFWSTLDTEDGLANNNVNHIRFDLDGTVWLATDSGLTRYVPKLRPPTVRIRSVEGDMEYTDLGDLPLFSTQETIRVHLATELRNRTYWQIKGPPGFGNWNSNTLLKSLVFRPQIPGEYLVEVMAVDRDLNRSNPHRLLLTATQPWHRNPWVLAPVGIASVMGVGGFLGLLNKSHKNRIESERLRKEALARSEQDRLGAEFARQLIRTQEAERSRLAHELHDSLGQELLLIRNTALLASQGHGMDRATPFTDIAERASRTIEELRNIAYALRPQELDRLGLIRALEVLCREMAEAGQLTLKFSAPALVRPLPPEIEISLYRVVQEALSNVVHHARASHLTVTVRAQEGSLRIVVQDDGVGFNAASRVSEITSLGLVGMAERLRLLHGEFSIRSEANLGTTVDFWLPLTPLSTGVPTNS